MEWANPAKNPAKNPFLLSLSVSGPLLTTTVKSGEENWSEFCVVSCCQVLTTSDLQMDRRQFPPMGSPEVLDADVGSVPNFFALHRLLFGFFFLFFYLAIDEKSTKRKQQHAHGHNLDGEASSSVADDSVSQGMRHSSLTTG